MIKITNNTLQRMAKFLFSITLLFALAACGGVNKPFNPLNSGKAIKASSIAVISGSHRGGDMQLAASITKGLAERSTFRVLSQDDIEKRVPEYPTAIEFRDDVKGNDEKAIWFKPSEKARLSAMQAKLKVDYLFVVWNSEISVITDRNGSTYYVYPIGNMIEYPGAKVVASTRTYDHSSTSILALFRSADYYIVDAMEDAADNIVDEFLDVTKSKKP